MTSMLLLDDSSMVNDLFAGVLANELQVEVTPLSAVSDLEDLLETGTRFDIAIVDLSFPEERRTGLDALVALHLHDPSTTLAIITQGDQFVAQVLRDAWELLPIATVISKTAPVPYQVDQVRELVRTGSAPIDPSVQPLLPSRSSGQRSIDDFARLVGHLGHAKLWEALFVVSGDVTYQQVVQLTGLRLNTVKNYRVQLLPELANHGMKDPSLRQMHEFAVRCRPILNRFIEDVRRRSRRADITV